jgi:hypothetical protein
MEEGKNQRGDEEHLGRLADVVAVDDDVPAEHEDAAEHHHQLLRGDDEDGNPGEDAADSLADQGGEHHELVRQRVEKLAEVGDLVPLSGQVSVQHVRQAGGDENAQRGDFQIPEEENDKDRNQEHAQDGQGVRNIPDVGKQFADFIFHGKAFFQSEDHNRTDYSPEADENPFNPAAASNGRKR